MDLLKKDGFSIMETLAGIVILGLTVVISFELYTGVFMNPSVFLRSEAFTLASYEMDRTIKDRLFHDTLYYNSKGSLKIVREAVQSDNLYKIRVRVAFRGSGREMIKLSAMVKK